MINKDNTSVVTSQVPGGRVTDCGRAGLTPLNCETVEGFEGMQRMANLLSRSALVPDHFRNSIPNCFLALEAARKLGVSVLTVCQNMFVIHGKPGWNAQFLIACFNASGRYSPIEYTEVGTPGENDYGMYASAAFLKTGQVMKGPAVTMGMAGEEGWLRNGKWKTMPQLMLRYRAATFFIRTTAPEIGMGIYTTDELKDIEAQDTRRRSRVRVMPAESKPVRGETLPEDWGEADAAEEQVGCETFQETAEDNPADFPEAVS